MIEVVIFDLDGTLVNLPIDYERLFEEFKRIMQTENVRPLAQVISRVDQATREILFKTWEKAELAVLNKVSVNAVGARIYQDNAEKRKALVTLQGRSVVNAILQNFKLNFEVIVTREDALPRSEQLRKAISQLGVDKHKVMFVGNTDGDANAASQVGCQFLRVE